MSNDEQIAVWGGTSGELWVAQQARLDTQLAPLGLAAIAALAPRAGESIVDIGCGAGQTTTQLAERVGSSGRVVGVDISKPLLAAARVRAPAIEFVEGDAQVHDFGSATYDAAFSRFGVMFFADPVAAFANLHRALRPGGRLAFVCWRAAEDNPIMTVPLVAAVSAGVPMPPATDPSAPGPFAFADRARLAGILETAGFHDVTHTPHDERVGGNDPAAALELALQIGPLARLLREAPQYREQAIGAVRDALVAYTVGDRVLMPSATWIVTARR